MSKTSERPQTCCVLCADPPVRCPYRAWGFTIKGTPDLGLGATTQSLTKTLDFVSPSGSSIANARKR